jgi:FHS family glucose/mannose:H+ symporter-like MFS transporter
VTIGTAAVGVNSSARWPIAVRLYLASFLVVGMSLSVLGPALSDLREKSGTGLGGIGVLFVGQSLGYIAGSFVGGHLYDRVDGHRVFSGAMLALGAALSSVALFESLGALFAVFVLLGFGGAVADLGANTLLMWQLGAGSGRAMNLLHLCFGLGALTAPLLVHVGLGVATRIAALGCLALTVWASAIPAPRPARHAREEHTDATLPLLFLLCGFFALYVGLEVGFAGWIHTYGEQIELSALAATWLTTTFWIGFTVGRAVASAVSERISPTTILSASCIATLMAAILLVVGGGRTLPVWIGTALMGVATAPQFAGMMNLAERRIHVTGAATRWFVGGAGIGGLVFPWVIGRWFDASGADALPLAMLVFGVATFAAYLVVERSLHR